MYPLDQGMWGPTVRIGHLRDELRSIVELDVVAGYRGPRRAALWRYAFSGRLRGLDGIYVESSTFLPAEADIAFLGLARALGIPVVTYIRDAYPLFPDWTGPRTVRQRIGFALFRPAMAALRAVSDRMAFPTRGLARAVLGEGIEPILLPPGSPPPVTVPRAPGANRLLFVGDARLPAHGADRLIEAVTHARDGGAAVELEIVCRPGQEPPGELPAGVRIVRAEGAGIADRLPDVLATVIPRPRGPYADLALPIKLYDYLSYGRPLLVTDCVEQARVVAEADAGLVTGDAIVALATGIRHLLAAGDDQLDRWSSNAHLAARAATWEHRARQIADLFAPDT